MTVYKALGLVYCMMLLGACGSKPEKAEEAKKEEQSEGSNVVSLTPQQMKTAGVIIGTIEMKNLTSSISVNGTLAVPNQNKALITSLVGGTLTSLNVQPGNAVRKGQVIGTIANTQLSSIQQQLIGMNAQVKYSEQELSRLRELVAGNAAPLKNLQKVESELNGLRAQQSALKHQLSLLGITSANEISTSLAIKAPITGTISEISAQIGSNIDPNSSIGQIINNSELHLDLFVYEKDLSKIETGQTIHFTLTNNPGKEYDAKVYSIGTAFVNETKSIPIHAKVINDKTGLIEGMSVTARISLGENVYPSVPDEAITDDGGKTYIFIISDKAAEKATDSAEGMEFQRIQVIKGASDIGYTEIKPLNELPVGTKVVTKGAFFLMAKMTNSGEDE